MPHRFLRNAPIKNHDILSADDDYDFMDNNYKDEFTLDTTEEDSPFTSIQDEFPTIEEELNPEKAVFKDFLGSLRDSLNESLACEANFKRLKLSTLFPNGDVGSSVYVLNVAEVRDKLQTCSSLLTDVFNAFASITDEPVEEEPASGFFTDKAYQVK